MTTLSQTRPGRSRCSHPLLAICLVAGSAIGAPPVIACARPAASAAPPAPNAAPRVDSAAAPQAADTAAAEPYVVEYYYKVRWGYQDEFWRLFRKNHLPVLERQVEKGLIREIRTEAPRYHTTEDGRWDYRVTLVFANVTAAFGQGLTDAEILRMYPDSATFNREERRRFELLLAHWDLPVVRIESDR
jgi:hypothetical protein